MPAIQSKIEGRGNGIKTNIPNMVDVAKALARPPTYTTKYMGYELGALTKCDEKSGTYIVNGAHSAQVLAQHLEGFIKRFVQCHSCGNPETVINITKKDTIQLKCKACGFVSDVDMRHKLTTFILKNPPEKDKNASKKDKQLRRAEKEREEEGAELDRQAEEERRRKKAEKKDAEKAGANACVVAKEYNVGIEIDHESRKGDDVEGLKSFVKGFRRGCPMGKHLLSMDIMGGPGGGGIKWGPAAVKALIPPGSPTDEPPEGDWSRLLCTTYGNHTTLSAVYNRGKRSLCLDMKHRQGIAVARRLARECPSLLILELVSAV